MTFKRIDAGILLDDPEQGFAFRRVDAHVLLSYRDWQNDLVVIKLLNVERFLFTLSPPHEGVAAGGFYEREEPDDRGELRHFLISTNEDEWCEVVAEGYEIADLGELVAE